MVHNRLRGNPDSHVHRLKGNTMSTNNDTNCLIANALDRNYIHASEALRNYLSDSEFDPIEQSRFNNHTRFLARNVSTARRAVRAFERMAGMHKVDNVHSRVAHNHNKRLESEREAIKLANAKRSMF